jgi:hypothetical protein
MIRPAGYVNTFLGLTAAAVSLDLRIVPYPAPKITAQIFKVLPVLDGR